MTMVVLGWLVEAALVAVLALLLARTRSARWLADHPNERSLHEIPVPKVGGVAIIAVALPVAAWRADAATAILLGCALFLAIVSFVDDLRSLPIQVRLPAHLVAAGIAIFVAMPLPWIESPWAWLAGLLAVMAVAWMTNLFNFMDGADGLAGCMGAIGFGTLAALAGNANAIAIAWCCAALAAACVGFLAVNWPPARVFMGDAGSIPLGFLVGALGVAGVAHGAWPAWLPVLVFSPFIVDASTTIARRALRGEKVWRAHREHAYQRLVLSGWTKRRLAIAEIVLMAAAAASAAWAREQGAMLQCVILGVWVAAYAILFLAIERHETATARDRKTPA